MRSVKAIDIHILSVNYIHNMFEMNSISITIVFGLEQHTLNWGIGHKLQINDHCRAKYAVSGQVPFFMTGLQINLYMFTTPSVDSIKMTTKRSLMSDDLKKLKSTTVVTVSAILHRNTCIFMFAVIHTFPIYIIT